MNVGTTTPASGVAEGARSYDTAAKWFHWITVVLLAIALPMGVVIKYISDKDDGVHKMAFYAIHESAGLTILFVALARLAWRLTHPAPPAPPGMPRVLRVAATAVHHSLYALLIVQPILGFVATNAWGFPLRGKTAYLGFIDFPKFMETNEALAGTLQAAHNTCGMLIVVLLVLHILGVVYHQAIRRDGTLLRMV
jgi:cytochrome b561